MNGLYAITDSKLTPYASIRDSVESALKGGAKIIQLRDKEFKDEDLFYMAKNLKILCHQYDALFILDDRLDLAIDIEADGVHIGKDDVDIEEVRERFNGIVGVSCYGNVERAKQMQEKGADYVAFGSFYPSPTKPHSNVVHKDVIDLAKEKLSIPICVIGGVTVENGKELLRRGADMLSTISDLWSAEDIERRALEYQKLFAKN